MARSILSHSEEFFLILIVQLSFLIDMYGNKNIFKYSVSLCAYTMDKLMNGVN